MEPIKNDELSDRELDALLPEWKAPAASPQLRTALFPRSPWWKTWYRASIRIPVPVALCAILLLVVAWWRWPGRVAAPESATSVRARVQPVAELQPRIIRRKHAQN